MVVSSRQTASIPFLLCIVFRLRWIFSVLLMPFAIYVFLFHGVSISLSLSLSPHEWILFYPIFKCFNQRRPHVILCYCAMNISTFHRNFCHITFAINLSVFVTFGSVWFRTASSQYIQCQGAYHSERLRRCFEYFEVNIFRT